ncbi:MAG: M13 family metallopeptidase [Gemmatimonadetes bacterium]|nr:M13 family metallopeptidase [Gemmatimonadota bacterium]
MNDPIMKRIAGSVFACVMLLIAGAAPLVAPLRADTTTGESGTPQLGSWGVELDAMDPAVSAGQDFFRYANGTWLREYEIPEDLSSYSSFHKLRIESEENVKEILDESAATQVDPGSVMFKVGALYKDYLDEEAIEKRGLAPLAEGLAAIEKLSTSEDVARHLAAGARAGRNTPFTHYIDQDSKNPEIYRAYFGQSGLTLPDRSYYLDTENERFQKALASYREYLTDLFMLIDDKDPEASAHDVIALETELAEKHWERALTRDRDKTYNVMTLEELALSAPGFPWNAYLDGLGLANETHFVIETPSAFAGMAEVFASTPIPVWRSYMKASLVSRNAQLLPKEFDEAQFRFISTAMTGAKEQRARWKRFVNLMNRSMGESVGRLYVERHFKPESKERMDQLVENLIVAFEERINSLEWMSEPTKAEALEKLAKFSVKIGYPDKWKDYSSLDVQPGDLVGNVNRAAEWKYEYDRGKLGGPVDRGEWFLPPQTVNAYYNPGMNEIVFPAAILQPPFFDPNADDAVNYGGIGAVIGHEIGHGFDDQGRKSDGDGVLREWWTPEDEAKFKAKAEKLVEQYNGYSPLEGVFVNGEQTLGENIGDLGGLEIAYHAYRLSLNGQEAPVLDGLTGDQRFFLGFAQIWRAKIRDETMLVRVSSGVHSPPEFRVNGIVRNIDGWYAAFDVKPGDPMYLPPEERVHIW